MYAASNDNPEMVRLLLEKGANIEAADEVYPAFDHIKLDTRMSLVCGKDFHRYLP
jgi:hypothetical protein